MLNDLTAIQMMEWEAFNRVQPIGGERWDFYFAQLMMTITNLTISVHGKQGAKQFKMEDFVPNWTGIKDEEEEMSAKEMKDFWTDLANNNDNITLTKGKRKKERKEQKN